MPLDGEDRNILCDIAREALAAAVNGVGYEPADPGRGALRVTGGCFVTLKTGGRLRGCLGCFSSDRPIYRTVAEYARNSALEDPRFRSSRLRPEELPRVEMDISVLSPLERCGDPLGITLGVHGIYVISGRRSGCFLPQVATETGWNVEEFWGHCCRDKAGAAWDAWRDPGTELMTFTAEVIGC